MAEHQLPPHTIDLRRPTTPPKAKRSFISPRPHQREEFHRVPMSISWGAVRREMLKFAVVVSVLAIPILIATLFWNINRVSDDVSTHFRDGLRQTAAGYQALNQRRIPEAVSDLQQAQQLFARVESRLQQAETMLWGIGKHLPWVAPRLSAANHVIAAAKEIAAANVLIATHLPNTGTWDSFGVTTTGVVRGSFGALQPLSRSPEILDQVADAFLRAYGHIEAVPMSIVPKRYRDVVQPMVDIIPALFGSPEQARHLVTIIRDFLGTPTAKEYLVLFQNDDEARATGGFPGTFLLVKFDHGTFTITDAPGNGPYALRDHVGKGTLPPPPILAIAPYWTFQDAAWFADVPTSASAVLDFYEQARGFRPNGVFFLTPHLLERLLAITGPIHLTDKDTTEVTATNFVRLIEEQVEFKYDKQLNAPKSVLINIVPEILNQLLRLDTTKGLVALTTFFDEFQRGNMTFTSEVPKVATAASQLHWSGELGTDRQHTLSIIRTNLGGGKTDRAITETDTVRYEPSGTEWNVTVTIDRQHFGDPADKLHGPTNRSFIRVYTDPRSRLIGVEGQSTPTGILKQPAVGASASPVVQKVEGAVLTDEQNSVRVTHESGYNVYGFWSLLPAGKQQVIKVQYSVPRDDKDELRLWLRKQPGNIQSTWRIEVADTSLKPLESTIGWVQKKGLWQWNRPSVYSETVELRKGG